MKTAYISYFKTASQTAKAASQGQHYLNDGLISMPLGFPYVSSASVFLCTFSPWGQPGHLTVGYQAFSGGEERAPSGTPCQPLGRGKVEEEGGRCLFSTAVPPWPTAAHWGLYEQLCVEPEGTSKSPSNSARTQLLGTTSHPSPSPI